MTTIEKNSITVTRPQLRAFAESFAKQTVIPSREQREAARAAKRESIQQVVVKAVDEVLALADEDQAIIDLFAAFGVEAPSEAITLKSKPAVESATVHLKTSSPIYALASTAISQHQGLPDDRRAEAEAAIKYLQSYVRGDTRKLSDLEYNAGRSAISSFAHRMSPPAETPRKSGDLEATLESASNFHNAQTAFHRAVWRDNEVFSVFKKLGDQSSEAYRKLLVDIEALAKGGAA